MKKLIVLLVALTVVFAWASALAGPAEMCKSPKTKKCKNACDAWGAGMADEGVVIAKCRGGGGKSGRTTGTRVSEDLLNRLKAVEEKASSNADKIEEEHGDQSAFLASDLAKAFVIQNCVLLLILGIYLFRRRSGGRVARLNTMHDQIIDLAGLIKNALSMIEVSVEMQQKKPLMTDEDLKKVVEAVEAGETSTALEHLLIALMEVAHLNEEEAKQVKEAGKKP